MTEVQLCKRCSSEPAVVVSRKEPFCAICFRKFISLKQRKQMMSDQYFQDIFKVMYQDKLKSAEEAEKLNVESRVLVPLSFGSASIVMLDVLNDTLQEQLDVHRGKVGFHVDIIVCYFDTELQLLEEKLGAILNGRLRENKHRYKIHMVNVESFYKSSQLLRVHLQDSSYTVRKVSAAADLQNEYTVKELLSSCLNRSAREDLLNIIRTAIIKLFATQGGYKAILWGHSMTRLADEIISLVVKGRASDIANSLNDSNFDCEFEGSFKNLHPMRDILLSEIDAYCHISELVQYTHNYIPQDTLLTKKVLNTETIGSKLTRNMTINELARQYFDNIEGNYANIISTVVRTGAKLDDPSNTLSTSTRCEICNSKLYKDGSNWLRQITVTSSHPLENDDDESLHDAWALSEQGKIRGEYLRLTADMENRGQVLPTCYGCILTLGEVKFKNIYWPESPPDILKETLRDFVLSDDDE
ncbi:LANO_0E12794g1_1 [Lachancea nothofagi CBS 11611]|uniref:Cytoplasmic tRNA 2-thiolation protein 2 n=1 Tax=Lachancea nothofagi CBS 11611 TaxID=1266666 RepID=A0A1G4JYD9_9SACH|nr:LANO_0E12794g1_1 [Lachancea nothofagi CBS 11611]